MLEYLAGTNPADAASYMKIDSVQRTLTNTLLLQFSAVSNRTYTLLTRDDVAPGTWSRAGDVNAAPSNRVMQLVQPLPDSAPQRYFRLVTPRMP